MIWHMLVSKNKYINLMMVACAEIWIILLPNYLANHTGIQVSPGARYP